MKAAVWVVFALIGGLWTAFVAASVALMGWAVSALGSGRVGHLTDAAAEWPVSAWLALWIDPALLKALQDTGLRMLQSLAEAFPTLVGLMDWLAPLMWVGWGFVLALMLVAAVALHWLVGRLGQR